MYEDASCIFMPHSRSFHPQKGLLNQIVGALATRFEKRPNKIRPHLPQAFTHWAKIRILQGGDTIHAASMTDSRSDRRDRTYVRVSETRVHISDISC